MSVTLTEREYPREPAHVNIHNNDDVNFVAYSKPLYHRDEKLSSHRINGYKGIWREKNTREIMLGVVGSKYKIIQNYELFSCVEDTLRKIFGDNYDVTVKDETVSDGASVLRQYVVKSTMRELDQFCRSNIAFRVIARNAFNGSASATVLAGAIDFFCTNGTILGEFDRLINAHSTNLNTDRLSEFIRNAYAEFGRDFEFNQKLLGTRCTRKHALRLLEKLADTEKFKDNIGKALDDNIVHHGWNLWAVQSTATWWSSTREAGWANPNGEAATNNAPLRRLERQKLVRAWAKTNLRPVAGTDAVAHDEVEEAMP